MLARLGVTAAFVRGTPNFVTDPPTPVTDQSVAVYHAMPAGLCGPMREPISPDRYVDISSAIDVKRNALSCHRSQKEWLDATQGMDSYVQTMEDWAVQMGRRSGRFALAEGWRRRLHLGFGPENFDPLRDALGERAGDAP